MADQQIKSLFVDRGQIYLSYTRNSEIDSVCLQHVKGDEYTVSLKSGQYEFVVDETGRGEVAIDLVGGGFVDGIVLSTIPDNLPSGQFDPMDITFKIRKK